MANSESWDITDNTSLRTAVRDETQYDEGKVSTEDLDGLIESAKRVLALKAGITSFYDERGIAVALLGITCAKAKGAVQNSPVRVKDIGGQNVTFRTDGEESLQLTQYEEMTQLGLREASSTDAGPRTIEFTRDFLHE
jgi:hypothetical protein